eukprot:GHVU01006887.1.p1 GENE.GHVU01006887.1~~GHVU01006887.1.p1  ORF type:complete len:174 (-),score=20.33 GHVU01006887.1:176-697(-)
MFCLNVSGAAYNSIKETRGDVHWSNRSDAYREAKRDVNGSFDWKVSGYDTKIHRRFGRERESWRKENRPVKTVRGHIVSRAAGALVLSERPDLLSTVKLKDLNDEENIVIPDDYNYVMATSCLRRLCGPLKKLKPLVDVMVADEDFCKLLVDDDVFYNVLEDNNLYIDDIVRR